MENSGQTSAQFNSRVYLGNHSARNGIVFSQCYPETGSAFAAQTCVNGLVPRWTPGGSEAQPLASFSFDAQYLTLPVRRDDADLRQMLARPLPLIVLQYRRDRLLSRRVRELLRTNLKIGNADEIAHALHVSTRSLYLHLSEEGTSLQGLKDQVRRDIAVEQLVRTPKTLKQVAAAAGFSNEASFNRAFKQWTGAAPGEYRERGKR